MNGGNPGIQTWTLRYRNTVSIIQELLQYPDYQGPVRFADREFYYDELKELGVIEKIAPKTYSLNLEKLRQHSVVVQDELYENLTDINWLREQRKQLGQIQGRIKDEEYRQKQQARRKKRREYAKQQKAKLEAQPPEDLPLSKIIF